MKYLVKIDRLAAWVLFLGLISYFITGYGMTKGIIDPVLATKIHVEILTYILLLAFVVHTSFAIHLAFKRWKIWNPVTKVLFVLFYAFFVLFFVWVDRFYVPQKAQNTENQNINQQAQTINQEDDEDDGVTSSSQNQPVNNSSSNQSQLKVFTLAELAQYDGRNGNKAYVAVDGLIYDVSSVFYQGSHYSHLAGQDLTNEFYIRHAKSAITKYPLVGQLQK